MANNQNLTGSGGFKKNPQNINKTGANRKSFASINKELVDKGVVPLTKSALIDAYSLVFNSTENELKDIENNKDTPYALRIIISELQNSKTKAKAIADYRDYMFGKAQSNLDIKTDGESLNTDLSKATTEELKKIDDLYKKLEEKK